MATRKLLKEREPAFDSFQATKGAKKSSSKGKLVPPVKKTKPETRSQKKTNVTNAKTKITADKLTKSQPVKAQKKDVAKPVTKKLKAPVKKTSITNTHESKETV